MGLLTRPRGRRGERHTESARADGVHSPAAERRGGFARGRPPIGRPATAGALSAERVSRRLPSGASSGCGLGATAERLSWRRLGRSRPRPMHPSHRSQDVGTLNSVGSLKGGVPCHRLPCRIGTKRRDISSWRTSTKRLRQPHLEQSRRGASDIARHNTQCCTRGRNDPLVLAPPGEALVTPRGERPESDDRQTHVPTRDATITHSTTYAKIGAIAPHIAFLHTSLCLAHGSTLRLPSASTSPTLAEAASHTSHAGCRMARASAQRVPAQHHHSMANDSVGDMLGTLALMWVDQGQRRRTLPQEILPSIACINPLRIPLPALWDSHVALPSGALERNPPPSTERIP